MSKDIKTSCETKTYEKGCFKVTVRRVNVNGNTKTYFDIHENNSEITCYLNTVQAITLSELLKWVVENG